MFYDMKLSLCLAVFNEEKNIHYPLDSVYDIADEIIIVDGGSEDKMVEIAKSYGNKVKIYVEKNPAMFHINKQKAIEKAKGEWILQLDADEELSHELKEELQSVITGHSQLQPKKNISDFNRFQQISTDLAASAFNIPRKNFFLTRFLEKGGQYPDYTIRLYKNGHAHFPCKSVHENVEVKGKIDYLKNPILHYADPDFSRYLKRWDRYTTLEVQNSKFKVQNENKNKLLMFLEYFIWKPILTFFSMYVRHKGFMDGFPGFVFALFSSIRFWAIYIKWRQLQS